MRKTLLVLIFLLAFILRFWQLGANPASLDWDEASLGYNAYSLLKTGKDEYGLSWPLAIRSFSDFKPPLYTYLTMVPVGLFGLNEFSTRFISAFFGTLTVLVVYFLVKELFRRKSYLLSVICYLFFAVSPWHIQFSRIAFEANLALFFFISGIWLFLKGLKNGKFFLLSFLSFSLSLYSYHSERLVVPLLLLGLVVIYRKEIRKSLFWFVFSGFLFTLTLLPLIGQLKATGARLGSVTVLNPNERLGGSIKAIEYDKENEDLLGSLMHNRRIVFGREILGGYLDHYNFDFLFLTGDPPGRHHAAGMGMLYIWDLPFILLGILFLLKNPDKNAKGLFWWFLVAPVASSITTGTPHAVRALLYLPTYQIFSALGITVMLNSVIPDLIRSPIGIPQRVRDDKKIRYANLLVLVTFSILLFTFYYYLHSYWIHTPVEYASSWQYGYKQAVQEVTKLESGFEKVIVTYAYDQPYIFFLFYNLTDPAWYQANWGEGEIQRANRSFGKFEFRNIDWGKDSKLQNTLLVGTPTEIPQGVEGFIKDINYPDGTVAFRIVGR